jgi:hypothetical protein
LSHPGLTNESTAAKPWPQRAAAFDQSCGSFSIPGQLGEALNIQDYLIDQEGKDWSDLLSGWGVLLPGSFDVWLVNRFGDVFAVFEDGSVNLLDVGNGMIERVANDRDEFAIKIDLDDNVNVWLMVKLVNACVNAGMRLSPNQCYGFKVPPGLGGTYALENIEPTDLSVHYSFLADICRQTIAFPDGTKVRIVVSKNP